MEEPSNWQKDLSLLNPILQPLCGKPLIGMFRAVGQAFEFGDLKPSRDYYGEPTTESDFVLKFIWADWRIIHRGRIILGSNDYDEIWFYESKEPAHSDYDKQALALARELLAQIESGVYVVRSVFVSDFADVRVRLSNDLVIEGFTTTGQDKDQWFFHDRVTDISNLVYADGFNMGVANRPFPTEADFERRRRTRDSRRLEKAALERAKTLARWPYS